MFSLGDQIEFLVWGAGAGLDGYRDEILAEIAGGGVDGETLAGGGAERDGCECSGCG